MTSSYCHVPTESDVPVRTDNCKNPKNNDTSAHGFSTIYPRANVNSLYLECPQPPLARPSVRSFVCSFSSNNRLKRPSAPQTLSKLFSKNTSDAPGLPRAAFHTKTSEEAGIPISGGREMHKRVQKSKFIRWSLRVASDPRSEKLNALTSSSASDSAPVHSAGTFPKSKV